MRRKVVPYIKTLGTEKFKKFLEMPFDCNMLDSLDDNAKFQTPILFDDWYGKNMGKWIKFKSGLDVVLEFYPDYYVIKKPAGPVRLIVYQLPFPLTLNDFINDMNRLDIDLYWSDWVDENFEPKDYLPANEIKNYFVELLSKMDKSQELQ